VSLTQLGGSRYDHENYLRSLRVERFLQQEAAIKAAFKPDPKPVKKPKPDKKR
jgi:hypothetical protein